MVKLIAIFFVLSGSWSAQAQISGAENSLNDKQPVSSAVAASEENDPNPALKFMDIWGTCYFYYNCQGNPIGLGKTGAECAAQGGHSLLVPNHGCYNF